MLRWGTVYSFSSHLLFFLFSEAKAGHLYLGPSLPRVSQTAPPCLGQLKRGQIAFKAMTRVWRTLAGFISISYSWGCGGWLIGVAAPILLEHEAQDASAAPQRTFWIRTGAVKVFWMKAVQKETSCCWVYKKNIMEDGWPDKRGLHVEQRLWSRTNVPPTGSRFCTSSTRSNRNQERVGTRGCTSCWWQSNKRLTVQYLIKYLIMSLTRRAELQNWAEEVSEF